MSLLYAMSWLCDAMLYFGALGCIGLLWAAPGWLFIAPLAMAAGCALGFRLLPRKRLWIIPPALAVLGVMAALRRVPMCLLCLPPAVYLFLYMLENRAVTDYYYAAQRFRYSLIALAAAMFLASFVRANSWQRGLPFLFAYFSLTIFLLRMLRADDSAVRSRRFRLMNILSISLVCAAGFALSQPAVVALLGTLWRFAANRILAPVASVLLYGIAWVLFGLAWLLAHIFPWEDAPMTMPEFQSMNTLEEAYLPPEQGGAVVNPVARALLIVVGGAMLAAFTLMLLRALARQMARAGGSEREDERESLDSAPHAAETPRPRLRRGDPAEGIRYCYLRHLRTMKARGGKVLPTMNTLQLRNANAADFDAAAMDELRALYLPVRYDGRRAEPADLRRAKEACERLQARDQGRGAP